MKPHRSKNRNLFIEVFEFLKQSKAWWLAPVIIMLSIAGIIIILGQSSAFAPFIYTLF